MNSKFNLENLFSPLHTCEASTIEFCKLLNVNVTKTTLKKDLVEHPNYPSLLSISDVIKTYGVDSVSIKTDFKNLVTFNTPFIAHTSSTKNTHLTFSVVKKIDQDTVDIFNPSIRLYEKLSINNFERIFKGVVLLAEKEEISGEFNFKEKSRIELQKKVYSFLLAYIIPILTLIYLLQSILNKQQFTLYNILFTLLSLLGSAICVLLLLYEIDQQNPILKEACQINSKANCSAILNSKASKLFGISWSIIGSTFFGGMLLSILTVGSLNIDVFILLAWLSILSLPYIFFSIYYQYKIAKQWCVLCLAIQMILFLLFLCSYFGNILINPFRLKEAYTIFMGVGVSFSFVWLSLMLLIPALVKAKLTRIKTIELQKFKHDNFVFENLLKKQKYIPDLANSLGLIIGNPNAKHTITKICNPYCGPCRRAHPMVEELMTNNTNIKLQLIFSVEEGHDNYFIDTVILFLSIASKSNQSLLIQALHDWYSGKFTNYNEFAKYYNEYLPESKTLFKRQTLEMRQWCIQNEIFATPTFFVNGCQLPNLYTVADLKYFFWD